MQVDTDVFLKMAEQTHSLCSFDLEATGLRCDYNSILVGSIKPYGKKPITFCVVKPGDDKQVVHRIARELEKYSIWVSYYGKGFDIPMIQGRLLLHGLPKLIKQPHLDMYFHMNSHVNTARKSQAHRCEWLDTPTQKMTVGAEKWNQIIAAYEENRALMRRRCESDTKGLEGLYNRTKHLVINVTR